MDIAYFWSLDTQFLRLTIDAFSTSALPINRLVEGAGTVESHSHNPTSLPIGVFPATFAFFELFVVTGFESFMGKQKGTDEMASRDIHSDDYIESWDACADLFRR